jgi:tetratricopeptide (TPR) repeat protein
VGGSVPMICRLSYNLQCDIRGLWNVDTWISKGNALYNLGQYNEAIVCYDKAIEIRPQKQDQVL